MLASNSNLTGLTPLRRENVDMYIRKGDYADWDLGIAQEVREVYYWDVLALERFTHVLDIGAHIGSYTVYGLSKWPDAQFVAVEPERENFSLLALNTSRFGNVQIMHGAVVGTGYEKPDEQYIGTLRKARTNSGGHLVSVRRKDEPEPLLDSSVYTDQSYYLPLHSFTDVLDLAFKACKPSQHVSPHVLMKLDCEGAEWDILRDPIVPNVVDCVVGEYHGKLTEFAELVHYRFPTFAVKDFAPMNEAQGAFLLRRN